MKISLIIVHWNTPDLLRNQLNVLLDKKDYTDFLRLGEGNISGGEIIVIDNASGKYLEWVKEEFPQVRLIENKDNLGYAAACNQGATISKGEWLLFLNPDVEITVSSIKHLIKEAEKKGFDACSPKTTLDYMKPLPTTFSLLVEFTPLKYFVPFSIFRSHTLFGGCLLIKRAVLEKLGGWDERYFLWFEDSDLTMTLKKEGYKTGWITQATIKHTGGASFANISERKKKALFFGSMNQFAEKHFSFLGKRIVKLLTKRYVTHTI